MQNQIALVEDGPGSYRFTFMSARGELSGRVMVGIEGPPDRRAFDSNHDAARKPHKCEPIRAGPILDERDLVLHC